MGLKDDCHIVRIRLNNMAIVACIDNDLETSMIAESLDLKYEFLNYGHALEILSEAFPE
jgi:hypothetical protein